MVRLTTLAAAAAVATAHPTYDAEEFRTVGRAEATKAMTFSVALPARNGALLEQTLGVISDPDSPLYGQWLSGEQVEAMTSADPATRAEVKEWVTSTGAKCVDMPTSMRCRASVAQVEKLLDTEVTTFAHSARSDREVHRIAPGTAYAVPSELAGKMMFMTSLVDFPTVRMRQGRLRSHSKAAAAKQARELQGADYMVLPESLSAIYQLKGQVKNMKVTSAPAEFQADQSWAASDVTTFAQQNGLADWKSAKTVGPFDPSSPDAEATLDFEYMGSIASPYTSQWYWTESDWMYEWVEAIKAAPDAGLPSVFSVSWGWSETNQCYVDPSGPCAATGPTVDQSKVYVNQTNQGFAAATARGITILVSSGDSGAHGRTDSSCSTAQTHPDWPTSSPWVTAVGATQLQNGVQIANPVTPYCQAPDSNGPCAGSGTEIVCSVATNALIVSGGGFSEYAAMPSYQASAVSGYLKSGALLPGTGNYNPKGRAYPDVAALGHNYLIWISGSDEPVDGTSCSAPVWGGVIALLNAQRASANKKPLGFFNPALYKLAAAYPAAFTDVTVGDNTCTEDGCTTGCTGYGATKGWDAVTGFGTPVFPKLAAAIATLP